MPVSVWPVIAVLSMRTVDASIELTPKSPLLVSVDCSTRRLLSVTSIPAVPVFAMFD